MRTTLQQAKHLRGALALAGAAVSCVVADAVPPTRPGGETTVDDRTSNAYQNPAPNLTAAELGRHLEGDVAFEATFVSPPAEVHPGLGPAFNNTGCARCHVRDGRGLPVAGTGPIGSTLLVRVSTTDGVPQMPGGPRAFDALGTQLQDHAVFGHEPEATVALSWIEQPGEYADGEPYSLRRPVLEIVLGDGTPLPAHVMTSARIPPPVFGLGLLEAVPEADILALADPADTDGDGISGRANLVWDARRGTPALGRFGWKANTPDLYQQAAAAYAEDMGVGSSLFAPATGEDVAEVDDATLNAVVFYTQTLAVPRRADGDDETVRGERLFRELGCAACHVEEVRTGDHAIAALRHQTIHPYTDLLLHNMGFELADGRPDFLASATDWRTPPLWGIGLAERVLPSAGYLHDGRARTLAEAILWHGGEAEASMQAFRARRAADRSAVLAFLRSL